MKLNRKQSRALRFLEDNITTEVEYGGAAGGGKSVLGCYWQLKRRLKYPGTRGLIGRVSLTTLKDTTLNTFFEVAKTQNVKLGLHYTYNQQSNRIYFANKSIIFLKDLFQYPADPNFDDLGSLEITDAFIDENNQTTEKAWNIVKSRIRYKLDENGLIPKMLGSCNPAKGWIYQRFYKPFKDSTLPADRQFIQALVTDNPDISVHYRQNLLGLDEASKQRLLFGNWEYDDDASVLMSYDKIIDCFTNDFIPAGERFITADVARFGKDKTVIGVWSGWNVTLHTFTGKGVDEVVQIIKSYQRQYKIANSNTIADEDGVGGGVVDTLKCKGFVNNSQALATPTSPKDKNGNRIRENYANLKSQCYYKLADRVNNSGLHITNNDTGTREMIIQELEQVKQHNMDKDGKKAVVPKDLVKEIIGRSPDYSDTLMMREWFELVPKSKGFTIAGPPEEESELDWV
jgi:phage terminase large subunit